MCIVVFSLAPLRAQVPNEQATQTQEQSHEQLVRSAAGLIPLEEDFIIVTKDVYDEVLDSQETQTNKIMFYSATQDDNSTLSTLISTELYSSYVFERDDPTQQSLEQFEVDFDISKSSERQKRRLQNFFQEGFDIVVSVVVENASGRTTQSTTEDEPLQPKRIVLSAFHSSSFDVQFAQEFEESSVLSAIKRITYDNVELKEKLRELSVLPQANTESFLALTFPFESEEDYFTLKTSQKEIRIEDPETYYFIFASGIGKISVYRQSKTNRLLRSLEGRFSVEELVLLAQEPDRLVDIGALVSRDVALKTRKPIIEGPKIIQGSLFYGSFSSLYENRVDNTTLTEQLVGGEVGLNQLNIPSMVGIHLHSPFWFNVAVGTRIYWSFGGESPTNGQSVYLAVQDGSYDSYLVDYFSLSVEALYNVALLDAVRLSPFVGLGYGYLVAEFRNNNVSQRSIVEESLINFMAGTSIKYHPFGLWKQGRLLVQSDVFATFSFDSTRIGENADALSDILLMYSIGVGWSY